MKNLVKLALFSFLLLGVFACSKDVDTQPEPVLPEDATSEPVPEVTDRANDYVFFSFQAGGAVDVQYTMLDLTTGEYKEKTWISFNSSNVIFYVPQENCVVAHFKARKVFNSVPLTWHFKRGNCPTVSGSTTVTAPAGTSWKSPFINYINIPGTFCHCN